MPTFAVGNPVQNVILADSLADAELATGQTCYEYNDTNPANIGWTHDDTAGKFIMPAPFPSWTFDRTAWEWDAPVPYPTDGKTYTWDEATLSWVAV